MPAECHCRYAEAPSLFRVFRASFACKARPGTPFRGIMAISGRGSLTQMQEPSEEDFRKNTRGAPKSSAAKGKARKAKGKAAAPPDDLMAMFARRDAKREADSNSLFADLEARCGSCPSSPYAWPGTWATKYSTRLVRDLLASAAHAGMEQKRSPRARRRRPRKARASRGAFLRAGRKNAE